MIVTPPLSHYCDFIMGTGWPSFSSQGPASPASNGVPAWGAPPANVGKSDAPPPTPANPMGRIRLSTVSDVAKEYRKLYREARAGTISTAEASKLGYLLNMLAGILTASDIEQRLAAIEGDKGKR